MAGTFISYRREDAAGYAGRLRESLERRLGEDRVFRDVDTLQPGQDYVQAIEARLAECRVMLAVIGREWLDARNAQGHRRLDDPYDLVRLEIAAGLARPDVLVVPVLVEGMAMPAAAALPEPIRLLARRHAVSVRDETWDADIERLAGLVEQAGGASLAATWRQRRAWPWLATSALAAAVLIAGVTLVRSPSAPAGAGSQTASTPATGNNAPPPASVPYTIDIPHAAEAGFRHLVYSVVSGNVVGRATGPELRLRIRLSNSGGVPANFWDDSFRLAVGSQVLTPTSGLNVVMASNSLGYGIVTFALPPGSTRGTLQIRQAGSVAEIPLDFSATGRPPVDESAEIADSLAQALVRNVEVDAARTLEAGGMSLVIERATRRQFVNTTRLSVAFRIRNVSRTSRYTGDLTIRAFTPTEIVAPWDSPAEAIAANSTFSGRAVFDLPPSAASVLLRVALGEVAVQQNLDLH